jgi:hypothetical protein
MINIQIVAESAMAVIPMHRNTRLAFAAHRFALSLVYPDFDVRYLRHSGMMST